MVCDLHYNSRFPVFRLHRFSAAQWSVRNNICSILCVFVYTILVSGDVFCITILLLDNTVLSELVGQVELLSECFKIRLPLGDVLI